MSVQIVDLYRQLFGKGGLQDGNVIEMAEHGRAGGIAGGQGFKFTQEADTTLRLDDTTTTNVTYIGKATVGTAASASSWQIKKLDETSGLIITWAEGNENYNKVWDDRASLTYS